MSTKPEIITHVRQLQDWRKGVIGRVGLVPTMGALHEGHATLLRKTKSRCDISVLSIFINPIQFGPKEDLLNYPKTFESDLELAAREGVDLIFAPQDQEMYPHRFSTYIQEIQVSRPLCGKYRPGHFRGVTTLVLKLFNLVKPQIAFFGLKDAQQFFTLEKMVHDLHLDIIIEGIATVRESDGLALSSRNTYLSQEERKLAPLLYRALQQAKVQIDHDRAPSSIADTLSIARESLQSLGFKVQYLECLTLPHFHKINTHLSPQAPYLLATAAYLGKTRLIDNVISQLPQLAEFGIHVSE